MSITSEIERIQGNIADTYDALEAKGATMPATENSANLASTVATIPESSRYGCSFSTILPAPNNSGVLSLDKGPSTLTFTGVKTIIDYALMYKFYEHTDIQTISFPDLESVVGSYGLGYTFSCLSHGSSYNYQLTTVSFPKLTSIGSYSMFGTFREQRNLTTITFPELTTIYTQGLARCFESCEGLTSIEFTKLNTITSDYCLDHCFAGCTSLQSISFPALTSASFGSNTHQFYYMLQYVTGCTVHFPSNLQSVIGSWSDVTNGFNGTNTTVLFDLTATE